jgi:hypothetical protein
VVPNKAYAATSALNFVTPVTLDVQ